MAPRASLKFSLVTCPIAMYLASTQTEQMHFRSQEAGEADGKGKAVNDARQQEQGA
ncbi:hypothetical protein SAMN03159423_4979 [Bradyrhizobium sp. NFR13]|jgi:non-homologous end joining protein Ku|uniref:hypothetical protein n=1 Tax=Bradyrhizobium sp. NFR13 TaxID=1566285 RepID=UPI0008E3982F|nr:hypothetical protein [Bradyrhizobium sp. NFR13]SFM03746.1 hypothetical protein SAMN03159423_4979 [Bradyrhizobium sp. NFR13]